jgi:hypothetical protein
MHLYRYEIRMSGIPINSLKTGAAFFLDYINWNAIKVSKRLVS